MKAQEFVKILRKVVREEITSVLNVELRRILNEEISTVTKPQAINKPLPAKKSANVVREYPIVTMEDILNETKMSMAGFGEMEEIVDPELPVTSNQTMKLVKDYSSLLKRADEIAHANKG